MGFLTMEQTFQKPNTNEFRFYGMKGRHAEAAHINLLFLTASLISGTAAATFIIIFPEIFGQIVNIENELAKFMNDYQEMSNSMWQDLQEQLRKFPNHFELRRKRQQGKVGNHSLASVCPKSPEVRFSRNQI